MPPVARTCSECAEPLSGRSPTSKTCGNACRLKRSRRLRRVKSDHADFEANYPGAGSAEVAAIVRRESYDAVMRVTQSEITPIVREALTEDVLRAVQSMIGLTPRAVELLGEDLESEDSTIRQRAYTLLIKYTAGHPALLQPKDSDHGAQLVVQFGLPRPDAAALLPPEAEVVEDITCDMCGEDKPATEFESGSLRCKPCFETWKATVLEQFA